MCKLFKIPLLKYTVLIENRMEQDDKKTDFSNFNILRVVYCFCYGLTIGPVFTQTIAQIFSLSQNQKTIFRKQFPPL